MSGMKIDFATINRRIPSVMDEIAAVLRAGTADQDQLNDFADMLEHYAIVLSCLIDPDTGKSGAAEREARA